uniref:LysM peptidoglycan-binding domain-containing protein n=1 Tax=Flavobacterium sp. TaxID=239 RepID=UPI00404B1DD2
MKLFKIVLLLFLLNGFFAFAQQTFKHKVVKGETIYGIAKKYDLKMDEVYSFNPEIKNKSLPLNYVLQLPNRKYKADEISISEAKTHTVEKGDTFYKVSKKYNTTIQKLNEYNPNVSSNDLKIGYVLQIAGLKQAEVSIVEVKEEVVPIIEEVIAEEDQEEFLSDNIYVVKKKETLYSIAKKNNTSVANLKELNPEIIGNLPVGYHLVLKKEEHTDEIVEAINENELQDLAPSSLEVLEKASVLIEKASDFMGVRYRYGGTNKNGIDCSGLMCETFKEIDIILPRSSGSQAAYGSKIKRKQAQKGDLIFFATNRKKTISHVGMITEVTEDEIKFIHASTSAGVIISSLSEPYYVKRFKQITRVLN